MDSLKKITDDIELHSVAGIRDCFESGLDPNILLNGKPLIFELISEYKRGPTFSQCVKMFVDYGLQFEDKVLLAVLMDDAYALDNLLQQHPAAVKQLYSFDCAFTQCNEVTLLHICAEFNHGSCAQTLVTHGADINAKAGVDVLGFGGQSPVYHTVNQHAHHGMEVLEFLLTFSPDLITTVKGITWGKGYPWETFIPAVNPISYAMMGLLPQFQRTETHIYEIVSLLIKSAYGIDYFPTNVPNKYLRP